MTPQAYCAEKVASAGSNLTAAFRLLEGPRRLAMEAVYAFCREVDDVADECQDQAVAQQKLAWWHQELDRAFAGTAAHPVGKALEPVIEPFDLPKSDFEAVLHGMARDLHPMEIKDFGMLDGYCDQVAGAVGRLSARVFGPCNHDCLSYATELGIALQYTNIIRDVGEDARRGRVYLPTSLLEKHRLQTNQILALEDSRALRKALAEMAEHAHARYESALRLLPPSCRKAQRPGLIMAATYRDLLHAIQELDFAVMHQRVTLGWFRKRLLVLLTWWGRRPR